MASSSRFKKILLVLIFLGVTIGLAWLLWQTFFAKPEPPSSETPQIVGPGNLPGAEEGTGNIVGEDGQPLLPGSSQTIVGGGPDSIAVGGLTNTATLKDSPTLNTIISSDGNGVQYYDPADGKFYRIDNQGRIVALSDKVFYNVEQVTWSPDKNKAILEYPDQSKIFYDFDQERQVSIPKHWEDFSFSPDNEKIVSKSIGLDVENRYLIVANSDGTQAKALEEIGDNADKVHASWSPNGQSVAMFRRDLDFNRQEVFFVGLNNENFKSTIIEGRDFTPQWSPQGDRLLYSVYNSDNNMNPKLWLVNAQGEMIGSGRSDLGLETWADKCTFAGNDKVYCAVPEFLPQGAGLFPELADSSKDDLYAIDLRTGQKKLIAVPNGSFNISQIMVSDNQKVLYFTDKSTQKLYKIDLP